METQVTKPRKTSEVKTAKQVKTIDIRAKEWFDKVNGNSYFAGQIVVNFGYANMRTIKMPFQYGYGSQYEQQGLAQLQNLGLINSTRTQDLREQKIFFRSNIETNCKQRDVKAYGL